MMLGSIFGTMAGLALPLVIVVFGFALTHFASYDITETVQKAVNNDTNFTYFCPYNSVVLQEYLDTSADPVYELNNAAHSTTYYALGIAVVVSISSFLSRILWAITGSRQARQIRLKFYESVLTRQVGWYDTNSIEEMPQYLSKSVINDFILKLFILFAHSSVPLIEKAIGTHISSLIQDGVTFLSCFVIALIVNWELTLVTSVLVPIIFVIAIVLSKVKLLIYNVLHVLSIYLGGRKSKYETNRCIKGCWCSG